MKILLVSPSSADDINIQVIREIPYLMADAFFAPHACAAIAALTPPEHEVMIHDEHLHGPVDGLLKNQEFDVVGVSLISNQINRSRAIAETFRGEDCPGALVVGGVGTAHMLPRMYELFDAVFVGEAEETWPRYLADLSRGEPEQLYRQIAKPDMGGVPIPRWELIAEDLPRYSTSSVQTSRGCPFDCSFCDVIYIFGRKLRLKPAEQVLQEVSLLQSAKVKMIYFADDNFSGNRDYAKTLLRELTELNRSFPTQVSFITQVDLTVADDEELLQLFLDANVVELQIGIESVDEAALQHMNKAQNLRRDALQSVRKIQSYGIVVLAHMIVGADSDDADAFERTARFIQEANIIHHACHPLMAPPGTKLWYDLKRQERIIDPPDDIRDRLDITTNIVPRKMSRVELMEGLARHWEEVADPNRYLERALAFIKGIQRRPSSKATNMPSPWSLRKMLFKMLWFFLFKKGAEHRRVFFTILRETWRHAKDLIPRAMFNHTCYMMEHQQAKIASQWARDLAARERQEGLPTLPPSVPIPEGIRQHAAEILGAAYLKVRRRIAEPNTLYRSVLEAMVDYVDRFGSSFDGFDNYQRDAVDKSCERVLARLPATPQGAPVSDLPMKKPPAGFVREMLDALDQAIRVRESY